MTIGELTQLLNSKEVQKLIGVKAAFELMVMLVAAPVKNIAKDKSWEDLVAVYPWFKQAIIGDAPQNIGSTPPTTGMAAFMQSMQKLVATFSPAELKEKGKLEAWSRVTCELQEKFRSGEIADITAAAQEQYISIFADLLKKGVYAEIRDTGIFPESSISVPNISRTSESAADVVQKQEVFLQRYIAIFQTDIEESARKSMRATKYRVNAANVLMECLLLIGSMPKVAPCSDATKIANISSTKAHSRPAEDGEDEVDLGVSAHGAAFPGHPIVNQFNSKKISSCDTATKDATGIKEPRKTTPPPGNQPKKPKNQALF